MSNLPIRKHSAAAAALLGLALFLPHCGKEAPVVQDALPESAVVMGENVSVRTDPISMASEVQTLEAGTRVKILKKSPEPVKIGKFNSHWYYVELESGLKGWVYGAKLSIASGKTAAADVEKTLAEDLEKQIVGRWWEIRPDGSTGYRKYVFYPDRKFKYAYGADYYSEGDYEVVPTRSIVHLEGKGSGLGDNLTIKRVGSDLRLQIEHGGSLYTFRRGDADPDGKEVTPADVEAKSAKSAKPKAGMAPSTGGAKSP